MSPASGLYAGKVVHLRRRPRRHRLAYRIFMLLLDLDEIEPLDRRLRLFAHRRRALASFHPDDHLHGDGRPLRAQVEQILADAGLAGGGAIRVLSMPRLWGGAGFNPLSVWFCHRPDGALSAVLYEVNNTFGQRHLYLIPAPEADGPIRQRCDKRFYVSPFMDMGLTYRFEVRAPGDSLAVAIEACDAEGAVLSAAFTAARRDLTDASLARAWAAHPLMSLGVLWAIRWEALWIWAKGEPVRRRPPPPLALVTAGPPTGD